MVSAWPYKWYQSKVMGSNPLADVGGEFVEINILASPLGFDGLNIPTHET
jgi:hypothetical protein